MADGELTLKIDQALTASLKARAQAAGEDVEIYALRLLAREDDAGVWEEVEAIYKATVAKSDGIPLKELEPWMRGWGKKDGPPPPR